MEQAVELQTVSSSRQELVSSSSSTGEQLASDLAPVDRGRDAWLFVVAAFIMETFIWGFNFTYGVFQNYYASSPNSPFQGSSLSALSAIGTTSLAVPYMSGMIIPAIMARYPRYIRPMMWFALVLGAGSFLLASFANAIWQLILLQGVLVGLAGGILYTPVFSWLYEWFVERRGLAGGIFQCGVGVGGAVFPPLIGLLLDRLGFRWTLRIWSAIFLIFGGIGTVFLKPRLPIAAVTEPRRAPMDFSYLKNPTFIMVSITILVQALAFFPVNLYIPTYTSLLGLPSVDGQLVLSVFNAFSVVGQILIGWMCDRMPYSRVMAYSALGSSLTAYLLWGFASDLGLVFAFVVFFGTLAGGFFSIVPPATTDLVGPTSPTSGAIFGSFAAVRGVASIVGPLIAASLFDPSKAGMTSRFGSHGFGKVTLFVGGMMAATAVCSILAGVASQVRRRHAAVTSREEQ